MLTRFIQFLVTSFHSFHSNSIHSERAALEVSTGVELCAFDEIRKRQNDALARPASPLALYRAAPHRKISGCLVGLHMAAAAQSVVARD